MLSVKLVIKWRYFKLAVLILLFLLVTTYLIILCRPADDRQLPHSFNPLSTGFRPKLYSQRKENIKDHHYGVVIDAGSSGSRLYIYRWPPHSGRRGELLRVEQVRDENRTLLVKTVQPGLASLIQSTKVMAHMKELLDFAQEHIPIEKHRQTVLYILATAGMRILSTKEQDRILKTIREYVPRHYQFQFPATHTSVITGKMEGIYSWIAVNYMLQRFSHNVEHNSSSGDSNRMPTVGILDMGGASTQVAFQVPSAENISSDNLVEINLGCEAHDSLHQYFVYSSTFLQFGTNTGRKRYLTSLIRDHISHNTSRHRINDPCLPLKFVETTFYGGKQLTVVGSGNFNRCYSSILPLLNVTSRCPTKRCTINGVSLPEYEIWPNEFWGMSDYYYTLGGILKIGNKYSFTKLKDIAASFCNRRWVSIEKEYNSFVYRGINKDVLRYQCFKSAWIAAILHEGHGFPKNGFNFKFADSIDGKVVQWTLGALLHRARFLPLRDIQKRPPARPFSMLVGRWKAYIVFREWEARVVFVLCLLAAVLSIIVYGRRINLVGKKWFCFKK